ncbi:MAG: hypothetical protein QXJ15_00705, partial [Candidatus Bathyarchaeia archaeon]
MRIKPRFRILISNIFAILAIFFLILHLIRPLTPFDLIRGARVYEESFRPKATILHFRDWYSTGTYGATDRGSSFEELEGTRVWIKGSMTRLPHFFNYSMSQGILLLRIPIAIPKDAMVLSSFLAYNGSVVSAVGAGRWAFFATLRDFSPSPSLWDPSSPGPGSLGDFKPAQFMANRLPQPTYNLGSLSFESLFEQKPVLPMVLDPMTPGVPKPSKGKVEFGLEARELLPPGYSFTLNLLIVPTASAMPADFEVALTDVAFKVHYVLYGNEEPPPSAVEIALTQIHAAPRIMQ